jgi:4-hydroxy-2-oxoheptanedioate aldolase
MSMYGENAAQAQPNQIRGRWSRGEAVTGTWLIVPAIESARAMGAAGFDCVIIEQQHAHIPHSALLPLIQAIELSGCTPLVRVGEEDLIGISRALDLGARGIVAPLVSTPQQARAIADAVRFPTMGKRSFGGLTHHASTAEANDDIVCIVMIETAEGVKNLDEIMSIPGIDGAVLGPSDLALDMGLEPDVNVTDREGHVTENAVVDAMKVLFEKCKRHGKHAGIITIMQDEAQAALEQGASFIFFGGDITYLVNGAHADAAMLRQLRPSGTR